MNQVGHESDRRTKGRVAKSLPEFLLDLFGDSSSMEILAFGVEGLETNFRASGGYENLVLGHMRSGSVVLRVATSTKGRKN